MDTSRHTESNEVILTTKKKPQISGKTPAHQNHAESLNVDKSFL